jgi:D-psicose/D-tagatose/L-ribulose 3-epimerase
VELTASPGALWPREYDLASGNPADRERGLAWHMRQVDLTAAVGGVAYTGALYGHPGVLHFRTLTDDEHRHVAVGLQRLAEHGAGKGVKIVIEPMSHFRTHVVNTAEQAMDLIQRAAHPNLYVLLDTYHMVTEVRDYAAAIRHTRDRLWGLHACESDRGVPGGGLVPWPQVFGTLNDIGFDGYVIFESYNSSLGHPAGSFAHRRGMLHDVCPDGPAFVRTGLKFVRQWQTQRSADCTGCTD